MNLINKEDKIFIAGGSGMVGAAVVRALKKKKYKNLMYPNSGVLDLEDPYQVQNWFHIEKPDVVILAAAKVGGIFANLKYPKDFLLKNLKIQNNVIENSYYSKVKRFIFLGSSCIYPKFSNQPIKEEDLLNGHLEQTNEAYSIAKISGIKLCEALRSQNNFDAISIMPTNLYGPGDNYSVEDSHVLPALIRKFVEAKKSNSSEVIIWGTGNPLREFLHVDDLAKAVVFALEKWDPNANNSPKDIEGNILSYLNVGSGEEVSIKTLVSIISEIVNFEGTIKYDFEKPDGTPRKLLDSSRFLSLGWEPKIKLSEGIKETINEYLLNTDLLRKDRNISSKIRKNNHKKKILLTGSTAQDSLLFIKYALSQKDTEIFGLTVSDNETFKKDFNGNLSIVKVRKNEYLKIFKELIDTLEPDWVINFMGITSSQLINNYDYETMQANLYLPLEFIKYYFKVKVDGKFFQPSSSYVFQKSKIEIDEKSAKSPSSIYGHSKNLLDKTCEDFRKKGFCCINAYLFSHESFLRNKKSFSMRILDKLKNHDKNKEFIIDSWNNLNDWSTAESIVDFVYKALNSNLNTDFVVGSGRLNSVFDYIVAINNEFKIIDSKLIVKGKPSNETDFRLANSSKAQKLLNWEPTSSIEQVSYSLRKQDLKFLRKLPVKNY